MKKLFQISVLLFSVIIFTVVKINGWPVTNVDKKNGFEELSCTNSDSEYPSVEIRISKVKMKLYLPDARNGYYREQDLIGRVLFQALHTRVMNFSESGVIPVIRLTAAM
jgi:hypothetical protein